MAGFLVKDAALFQNLSLTADFVSQAVVKVLEGVHVLELGFGAQLSRATATQGNVAVATQRAFFHRAVGNANGQINLAKLLHKQTGFFGRTKIGLSYQLDKGRTCTVIVNQRMGSTGNTTFAAADVDHLARILFHMDTLNAHMGNVAVFGTGNVCGSGAFSALLARLQVGQIDALLSGSAVNVQIQMAAHAEGNRALRGLEVLGHIGIHVVLAVEHRALLDIAVGGKASQHDRFDCRLVRHWQSTGQAETYRAGMRVGLSAKFELAATEHLGFERGELGVDFQADNRFPIFEYLFELLHGYSPSFPSANAGATGAAPYTVSSAAAARSMFSSLKAGLMS